MGHASGTISPALTFAYNAATQTITLTLAASSVIGSNGWFSRVGKNGDRLTLSLDGATVQAFSVLPGDYDGNGVVNLVDINAVRRQPSRASPIAYSPTSTATGS